MWSLDGQVAADGDQGRVATIVLVRRRPPRAVMLAALVAGLLALVPLVIAPDPGPLRLLTFALLALSAGALLVLGRTRPERVELAPGAGGLKWGGEPLPPPSHVALGGDPTEEPPRYVALVTWPDGRERLALEGDQPGPVLAGALALARRLGLELRPGWGLERHFPRALGPVWERLTSEPPSERGSSKGGSVELPIWPAQRRVAATTLVAGFFVLISTGVFIRSPERTIGPSALELALPGLASAVTIALGALFWGLKRRLELTADGIDSTLVLFGKPFGKTTRLAPATAPMFAVSPDHGPTRHVLILTPAGPLSVIADREGAELLDPRSTEPAVSERHPAELAPQAELPLATSARYQGPDRPARLRS